MRKMHYARSSVIVLIIGGITIAFFNPKRPMATDYVRNSSHAITPDQKTALKEAIDPEMKAHSHQSGFELLTRGRDALLLRIGMIEAAERSLDIQYYVIQDDITGKLILEAILRAAERGVRVRILMDDLNLRGADTTWPLLNASHNIEIRIFNPFATRDEPLFTRVSDVFTGLSQFDKRMHNKILVSDNQLAITGGRNLGDEYFNDSSDFNFRDADVLAVGPIVASLSESFDRYWNDDESFPIAALHHLGSDPEAATKFREQLQRHWQEEIGKGTIISQEPLAAQIKKEQVPLLWADAELATDAPSKIDLPKGLVSSPPGFQLTKMANQARHEFIIISPYLVPGNEETEALKALVRKGIKVKILTNSLASTNSVAAHSGYQHYRRALVEGGVDLYEMRPVPGTHPHASRFSSSSPDSLHSKIYIADRRDVIIGSFNLDPRSVNLNTEMVLVIHSPVLADQLVGKFEKAISSTSSFHLVMHNNHLEWLVMEHDQEQHYESEPEVGFWRNIEADLFEMLPLEHQL